MCECGFTNGYCIKCKKLIADCNDAFIPFFGFEKGTRGYICVSCENDRWKNCHEEDDK